jgi:hypothetical protein
MRERYAKVQPTKNTSGEEMGVNATGLGLLALARASGADFSRVVTIGRQSLSLSPDDLAHFFTSRGRADIAEQLAAHPGDGYCEQVLKLAFGARTTQSIDASDYEQAGVVHDMNMPLAPAETYSVVMDFGTLEHVFNVPVAFDNVAALASPGGWILHMLPGNNLAGHGFYQFSPELFFQIYAPERGYEGTRVFAAPESTMSTWYEVTAPRDLKKRVDITSRDQVYLLVLTQKVGEPTPLTQRPVQQSDYVALWSNEPKRAARSTRKSAFVRAVQDLLTPLRHRAKVARKDVAGARSDMTARRVLDLTAMPALAVAVDAAPSAVGAASAA